MSAIMVLCVLSVSTIAGDIPDMIQSSFTYQGNLEFNGVPANGDYYFRFSMFDTNGTWQGSWYSTVGPVTVTDGLFTAEIMMGDDPIIAAQFWRVYGMAALTMLIEVGEVEGLYTALSPRVAITAAPQSVYSIRSMSSNVADMLQFPYYTSRGITENIPMFHLRETSGDTVAFFETVVANVVNPVVQVEGFVGTGMDFGAYNGLLRINTISDDVGLMSSADSFPIIGHHFSSSSFNRAAILGEVDSAANANIIALWALNHASGNNAALGTGSYAGDFSGDVLARNNLRVQGEPTRDYAAGSPSPIGPLAYGSITSLGSVSSGTANLSVSWDAANLRYVVSVADETLAFSTHSVSITVVDSFEPRVATFIASAGDLLVYIWDLNSGNVKVPDNFTIVIYDAAPVVLNRLAVPDGVDLDKYSEETGAVLIQTQPRNEPVEPFENYGSGVGGQE